MVPPNGMAAQVEGKGVAVSLRFHLRNVTWLFQIQRHNLRVRFVKLRTGWWLWTWKVKRYLARPWR